MKYVMGVAEDVMLNRFDKISYHEAKTPREAAVNAIPELSQYEEQTVNCCGLSLFGPVAIFTLQ